jgi:NADP-dependent 3-hydroxy acid dehydrogenase YdfG
MTPGRTRSLNRRTRVRRYLLLLLENKTAVIYGGSGKIASAVATAFAREGARIFLAGRTLAKLERVAERLQSTGATVDAAELDALNEQAVDAHTQAVIATAGSLDISFN